MDQLNKHTKILNDLRQSLARLEEAVAAPHTQLNQDATIKRFEFTFELYWKLMKAIVEFQGENCASPRFCIRKAADLGIIDQPEKWLEFLDERNALAHAYKSEHAVSTYQKVVKEFPQLVKKFIASAEIIEAGGKDS